MFVGKSVFMTTFDTCDCTHYMTLNWHYKPGYNWTRDKFITVKMIIVLAGLPVLIKGIDSWKSRNLPLTNFLNDSSTCCSHTGRQLSFFPDSTAGRRPKQEPHKWGYILLAWQFASLTWYDRKAELSITFSVLQLLGIKNLILFFPVFFADLR